MCNYGRIGGRGILLCLAVLLSSCGAPSERQVVADNYEKTASLISESDDDGADSVLMLSVRDLAQSNLGNSQPDRDFRKAMAFYKKLTAIQALSAQGFPTDTLRASLVSQLRAERRESFQSLKPTTESMWFHHPAYLLMLIVLVVFILIFLFYQHREEAFSSERVRNRQHQDVLSQEIGQLQTAIRADEDEIVKLNRRIRHLQETRNEHLGIGRQVFDRVREGGTMKNISVADEQAFVDYYAMANPQQYARLTSPYHPLSLRHTTYLILTAMDFSDADIQRILFVKDSTIRNYRLRISRKRRTL